MKCVFKGSKQDLLDLGFEDEGWNSYIIKDWKGLELSEEEQSGAYLALLIDEKDNTISFWTSNVDFMNFPDCNDNLYSEDLFYKSLVDRYYPLDIVCKLFMSNLVDLIEEDK